MLTRYNRSKSRNLKGKLGKMKSKKSRSGSDLGSKNKQINPLLYHFTNEDFKFLKALTSAPSPVGYEAAMTYGVIEPYISKYIPESWSIQKFKSMAGLVIEKPSSNKDALTIMFIGHADKVRMQVKHISKDGKIYIISDSLLPLTLIGQKVIIFSKDPNNRKRHNAIPGRVQALQPIHYIDPAFIMGKKGVKKNLLYIDLNVYSRKELKKLNLGIQVGDPIIFDSPIHKTLGNGTFTGAYLDNGVGCFSVTELAKHVAKFNNKLDNVRLLFAIATHEEINRYGSRVLAKYFNPDILIGVDACHDYVNAHNITSRHYLNIEINKGFTITVGSVISNVVNDLLVKGAELSGAKYQIDVSGTDTNRDAMAGFLSSIDSATATIGIPVLNMHTSSESGSIHDITDTINGLFGFICYVNDNDISHDDLKQHIDLSSSNYIIDELV